MDRQMDKKQTNRQTNGWNYTNFKTNLAMMVIYVPVKFEFDWTNRPEMKNVDGQTDRRRTHQSNRRVGYTQEMPIPHSLGK